MFLIFSNHVDVLMLKIIFKKSKNIINVHFNTKNYLKTNRNYTDKEAMHALAIKLEANGVGASRQNQCIKALLP